MGDSQISVPRVPWHEGKLSNEEGKRVARRMMVKKWQLAHRYEEVPQGVLDEIDRAIDPRDNL